MQNVMAMSAIAKMFFFILLNFSFDYLID